MIKRKIITYVGPLAHGSTTLQRMNAFLRLNYKVYSVDTKSDIKLNTYISLLSRVLNRLGLPIDWSNANTAIINSVKKFYPDILWIDKGLTIKEKTLIAIKKISPKTTIIGYSPDDMFQKHSQSYYFLHSLKHYDYFLTTKTYNVNELIEMGAKKPIFIPNAFAPELHKIYELTDSEKIFYGGDVGFIGAWEKDRAGYILALARAGIKVRWWGWQGKKSYEKKHPNLKMENQPLWGEDYAKAINAFNINLCFLRKLNRDLQTTRSIEIPACGGFMLAERTSEHMELFKEDVEACFFSTKQELAEKVFYYLNNPIIRKKIADAGRQRCLLSGYSNDERIKKILQNIE